MPNSPLLTSRPLIGFFFAAVFAGFAFSPWTTAEVQPADENNLTAHFELKNEPSLRRLGRTSFVAEVELVNQSQSALSGPIWLAIQGSGIDELMVKNADGRLDDHTPYLEVVAKDQQLAPKESARARQVVFTADRPLSPVERSAFQLQFRVVRGSVTIDRVDDTSEEADLANSEEDDRALPPPTDPLARAMHLQDRWTARLMQRKAVVGTAAGLDSGGNPHVLVVAEHARVEGLPQTIEGVPVRLLVTGRLFARQAPEASRAEPQRSGNVSSYNSERARLFEGPVPIGSCAANAGEFASAGTIGCRVVDPLGRQFALSTNHAYALNNAANPGDEIVHPGPGHPREQNRTIAQLARFAAIDANADNRVDASIALVQPNSLAAATPEDGYGRPSTQTVGAEVSQRVQKYGGITGLTQGRVVAVNATVEVAYSGGRTARFVDQVLVQGDGAGFLKAGDSGALLVTADENRPVGLLFAGSLGGTFAVANPIDDVLNELGVAIDDGQGDAAQTNLASLNKPAFPGAEGYGAAATGGRGGEVIEVTNLNDSGSGSLRAAVEADGPRIVVFKVGGTIWLESELEIGNPDITIAGQTAPGDGITLRFAETGDKSMNSLLSTRTQNVVLRYLRLRRGEHGGSGDSLHVHDGSNLVIADHVSITWATDENLDIYSLNGGLVRNITVQNSLIGEALDTGSGSALGSLFSGLKNPEYWRRVSRIDVHHSVIAHNTHRNPRVVTRGAKVVNNIMYNWRARAASTERDTFIDWIGNEFIRGPMSDSDNERLLFHGTTNADQSVVYPDASIYITRNIAPSFGFTDPAQDNWPMLKDHYVLDANKNRADIPIRMRRFDPLPQPQYPITVTDPGAALRNQLLAGVGANRRLLTNGGWFPAIDPIDRRILADVIQGTGPVSNTLPATADVASAGFTPADVDGGYADADVDGMSDDWEQAKGFDANDPADGPGDDDGDGWTNVEEFLNGTDPHVAD